MNNNSQKAKNILDVRFILGILKLKLLFNI